MQQNITSVLIHPEIWEQALPAILACRAKVRQHLESGGWCLNEPLRKMRRVGAWDWPSIERYGKDGPLDRPSLFKAHGDYPAQIPHSEVPELERFFEYCYTRTDLAGTLLIPPPTEGSEGWSYLQKISDVHMRQLVLDVMDRCENVGAVREEEIRDVYAQMERSIFQHELPAEILVPIAMGAFELDEPLQLDEHIRIEPMDEPTQLARVVEFNRSVSVGAAHSATHALVISDVIVDNRHPWAMSTGRGALDSQRQELIDRAFQALRVFVSAPIGYAQVLLRPLDWSGHWEADLPPLSELAETRAYPAFFDDVYWGREKHPIPSSALDGLPELFLALGMGLKAFDLAVRRLDLACQRTSEDDKVLDCAIGLEALLGEESSRTELSHRLALRGATLLSPHRDPEKIYKAIKYVYDCRSKIVHGVGAAPKPLKVDGIDFTAARIAVLMLRYCIKAVAGGGGDPNGKELDRKLLQALRPRP